MSTTNAPRRIGAPSQDHSFRAVGRMESTHFRNFLRQVALVTLGACYNEVTDKRGMSVDVEKALDLLLAANFVETMNGQRGFDFNVSSEPVYLTSDDAHLQWWIVEESALYTHGFAYRPFTGLWMGCRYLPDEGAWLVDFRSIKPEGELNLAQAHRFAAARVQAYQAFCEAIRPGTYSTIPEGACEVLLLPLLFARVYKEFVEPEVCFVLDD